VATPRPIKSHGDDASELRGFTSRKLDWLSALASDPEVSHLAFRVASRIAESFNKDTSVGILSDTVILDDLPAIADRFQLNKVRKQLEELGWLEITRGNGNKGTRYRMLEANVNRFLDIRVQKRDERNEDRAARRSRDGRSKRAVVREPHKRPSRRGPKTTSGVVPRPPVHLKTPSEIPQGRKKQDERSPNLGLHDDELWDRFEERAAFLEYHEGLTRSEAERIALREFGSPRKGT